MLFQGIPGIISALLFILLTILWFASVQMLR